jgi:hypothetical protein
MIPTRSAAALLLAAAMLAGCAGPSASEREAAPAKEVAAREAELARGREQLVRAFDAAWIRVIASGKDQEILKTEPPNQPGMAQSYMVRLADCLPQPEIAPWPAQPVGLFKEILERGTIRRVVQAVPSNPQSTSYYFSGIADKYLDAVLEEVAKHYGVKLKLEDVSLPPGPLPSTSVVLSGKADFIDQLNATGGDTQGMRRRISRRFTCTMSASSQYVHVPVTSPLAAQINTFNDLIARPDVRICAGPLTTQTARAYMPKHQVSTKYVNDLSGCEADIRNGKADVIMNPLPSLQIAGMKGYKSVHTLIASGTPLWVAKEGIVCQDDGNPRTEDPCSEVDPP